MGHKVEIPRLSSETIQKKDNAIDRGAKFLAYKIVLPLMILGGTATWALTDADTTGQILLGMGIGIPILHGIQKFRNRFGHQASKHFEGYKEI